MRIKAGTPVATIEVNGVRVGLALPIEITCEQVGNTAVIRATQRVATFKKSRKRRSKQ